MRFFFSLPIFLPRTFNKHLLQTCFFSLTLDSILLLAYAIIMKVLKFLAINLIVIFTLLLGGCSSDHNTASGKLQVAASFYPMGEFAKAVGGDKVEVTILVPDGAEPHDWEPSPRDLTKLGYAKVFVYNGIVEPWAEEALEALQERKICPVQTGEGLYTINGKEDPHVWVSPYKAREQVTRIKDAYIKVDPQNKAYYEANAAAYIKKLNALDAQLRKVAAKAPKKVFVTSHAAFGHLAYDYNLQQLAVNGVSPEAEPTPRDLQRLIKVVKKEKVKYIFFETLADPKIAQLVAKETGAEAAVLDPIEGLDEEGRKEGLNYLKITEENILNLAKALKE